MSRRRSRSILHACPFFLAVLAMFHASANAATLNVPSQYATISAALGTASTGDTIALDPAHGPYSDGGDYNLDITKGVTIESSSTTVNAVIDCSGNAFARLSASGISLIGLTVNDGSEEMLSNGITYTIRNCDFEASDVAGDSAVNVRGGEADFTGCRFRNNIADGAVQTDDANLTFTNCTFTNNTWGPIGGTGAISGGGGSLTVESCSFSGNVGLSEGGAVNWSDGPMTVTDSAFTNNSASTYGGAVRYAANFAASDGTVSGCVFSDNSSQFGGAVVLQDDGFNLSLAVTDCVFQGNSASGDGSVADIEMTDYPSVTTALHFLNSTIYCNSCSGGSNHGAICASYLRSGTMANVNVTNTILYGDLPNEISTANPPATLSAGNSDIDQAGYAGSNGNIDADPEFAEAGSGDFHIPVSSPCAGAGTTDGAPSTDIVGYAWGKSVSMGAYSPIGFKITTPSTVVGGTSFQYKVTAYAADGVTAITNFGDTVHFTSSDASAVLPVDSTLTIGTKTFHATLKSAGSQKITATDTTVPSIAGMSGSIEVSPSAATHFVVEAPAQTTAGTAFHVTVTAIDAYGNVATGYAGKVVFSTSDAAGVVPIESTLSNGTRTFTATLKTAANQLITAADPATPSITGTSAAIEVIAASATHFKLTVPATSVAGTSINLTVTAYDQFDNLAVGYNGTIHFASTDKQAELPSNSDVKKGFTAFKSVLKTAGDQTISVVDIDNSKLANTSAAIDVAASSLLGLTLSAPSTATTGTPVSVIVKAVDQYGNPASFTGKVHFTSTDSSAILPADSTLKNGSGSFSVSFRMAGNQALAAIDTTDTAIISVCAVTVTTDVLHTFAAGLQMISAPVNYAGLALSDYFTPTIKAIAAWEPSEDRYAVSPNAPADAIRPGVGYWANFGASTELLSTGVPTNLSTPVTDSLSAGWNMIGDPFGTAVSLSTGVSVTTNDASGLSFAAAAISGIVSPTLYTLSAGATKYASEASNLQPYAGYWVYASVPCTLTISGN